MKMTADFEALQKLSQHFDPAEFGRVAVLMGGTSAERTVSLNSGGAILKALQHASVDCLAVDPADGIENLVNTRFDRAFIALHGRGGEDGTIQGLLELMNRPYTGSGVLASALAMDKLRSKRMWQELGLPTPKYVVIETGCDWQQVIEDMQGSVMVKPAHEGSSIGMHRAVNGPELEAAWRKASHYDDLVFAEQWITGKEFTVALLAGNPMPVIGLETNHQFYDYDAKYVASDTRYLLPSGLSPKQELAVQSLALEAFQSLDCKGWGRADFMQSEDGQFWLLEVNTVPGMTDHSLVPMSANYAGLSFNELVLLILAQTLVDCPVSEASSGQQTDDSRGGDD